MSFPIARSRNKSRYIIGAVSVMALALIGGPAYVFLSHPGKTMSPSVATASPIPLGQPAANAGPSLAPAPAGLSTPVPGGSIIAASGVPMPNERRVPSAPAINALVVLNGTKTRRLAAACQKELQVVGIAVGKTGNFRPVPQAITFMRYGPSSQAFAESVRKALGGTVPLSPYPAGQDGPAVLVLGDDFATLNFFRNVPLMSAPSTTKAAASVAVGGF